MPKPEPLPVGIRNNNPGNLRGNFGLSYATVTSDGYAKMHSMADGLYAMARLLIDYYEHLGLRTLDAIIGRYAPASENDVSAYIRAVCQSIGHNPLSVRTDDMHITDPWCLVDLMRAMIRVENGRAPASFSMSGDWIHPTTLAIAARDALLHDWKQSQ